jgi:hypothetical protein
MVKSFPTKLGDPDNRDLDVPSDVIGLVGAESDLPNQPVTNQELQTGWQTG